MCSTENFQPEYILAVDRGAAAVGNGSFMILMELRR
jgi:hypothetical protein